jgi:hypothetical protein
MVTFREHSVCALRRVCQFDRRNRELWRAQPVKVLIEPEVIDSTFMRGRQFAVHGESPARQTATNKKIQHAL